MLQVKEANEARLKLRLLKARFEVLTAVKISMVVFWVVTPCQLTSEYQSLKMEAVCSSKTILAYKPTRCHNPVE
jgi:hypothetical protein